MLLADRFGLVALIAKGYRALAAIFLLIYVVPLMTIGVARLYEEAPLRAKAEQRPEPRKNYRKEKNSSRNLRDEKKNKKHKNKKNKKKKKRWLKNEAVIPAKAGIHFDLPDPGSKIDCRFRGNDAGNNVVRRFLAVDIT
jgi:hypothetical protein